MKRRAFVFWGALAAIVAVVFGAFIAVRYYRMRGDVKTLDAVNAYLDIFRNDTYGGATPEETLRLFVEALKAGDVELASKYFMPDDNGSREKWEVFLQQNTGKFSAMADAITAMKPDGSSDPGEIWFKGLYEGREEFIQLVNNGKVWKIESL